MSTRVGIELRATGSGQVQRELDRVTGGLRQMTTTAGEVTRYLTGVLASAASAGGLTALTRRIAEASDELTALRTQMTRLAGDRGGFGAVVDLADELGARLTAVTQSVNTFAAPLAKLGQSFQGTLRFIADLNKALRVYGVTGQEAERITVQLAQAFSSGKLQGDELRSLSEQGAGLYAALERAVQEILNTGDSLKSLGSQGEVTSAVLFDAFSRTFGEIRGDMESLPETLAQQENALTDAMTILMASLDGVLKASELWKWFTGGLANAIRTVSADLGNLDVPTEALIGRLTRVQTALNRVAESNLLGGLYDVPALLAEKERILGEIAGRSAPLTIEISGGREGPAPSAGGRRGGGRAGSAAAREQTRALEEYKRLVQSLETPQERFNRQIAELNVLRAQMEASGNPFGIETYRRAVIDYQDEFTRATDKAKDMTKVADDLGFAFESAFEAAILSGNSLREVLKGLAQDILQIAIRQAVTKPIGTFIGNLVGGLFGGGKAAGGPVTSGTAYLVGERGPELFVPRASGAIVPHGGGLAPRVSVTVNNLPGQDARVRDDGAGGLTIDIVRAALADDARRGGQPWTRAMEGAYGLGRGRA